MEKYCAVWEVAKRDINYYINENSGEFKQPEWISILEVGGIKKRVKDVFIVKGEYLYNKKERHLNKELGIHSVNM